VNESATIHGMSGVENQVGEDEFEVSGVNKDIGQRLVAAPADLYFIASGMFQQLQRGRDDRGKVDFHGSAWLEAGEGQQLFCEFRGAPACMADVIQIFNGKRILCEVHKEHICESEYDLEHIVEFVGNTSGECSHGFHALRVSHAGIQFPALLFVDALLSDLEHEGKKTGNLALLPEWPMKEHPCSKSQLFHFSVCFEFGCFAGERTCNRRLQEFVDDRGDKFFRSESQRRAERRSVDLLQQLEHRGIGKLAAFVGVDKQQRSGQGIGKYTDAFLMLPQFLLRLPAFCDVLQDCQASVHFISFPDDGGQSQLDAAHTILAMRDEVLTRTKVTDLELTFLRIRICFRIGWGL